MKAISKFFAVVAMILSIALSAKADITIDASILPKMAKSFITQSYGSITIRECERDDDGHYEVELRNGVDLEFDVTGKLSKIDAGHRCLSKELLKKILPDKVYKELDTRKVISKVEEVEFNRYNIKVGIRQMWDDEYIFDLDGNLQSIND